MRNFKVCVPVISSRSNLLYDFLPDDMWISVVYRFGIAIHALSPKARFYRAGQEPRGPNGMFSCQEPTSVESWDRTMCGLSCICC